MLKILFLEIEFGEIMENNTGQKGFKNIRIQIFVINITNIFS